MNQRSLVFAIAKSSREDAIDPVGLVSMDSEFQCNVAGIGNNEIVDSLHHCELIFPVDFLKKSINSFSDFIVGSQLFSHQTPIVFSDLVPTFIRRDMQSGGN